MVLLFCRTFLYPLKELNSVVLSDYDRNYSQDIFCNQLFDSILCLLEDNFVTCFIEKKTVLDVFLKNKALIIRALFEVPSGFEPLWELLQSPA